MSDSNETTPPREAEPVGAVIPVDASATATPSLDGYAHRHATTPYAIPDLAGRAPVGRIRSTGACIALAVITLGFYSLYWFYSVHSEMKRHSGQGLGGGLALVLAIFVGFIMPFLTSGEAGNLYQRANLRKPVSGATGLWYLPGSFILIGPLVWFIKTNAAVNNYWRMHGAA